MISRVPFLKDERLQKVFKSYSVSMMARALGLLVTLLTTPWLLDYLGKSGFGLWSVFVQFFTFAAFSDFGISNGLHNTLLKTRHQKEWQYNLNLIQNTVLLMAFIALLMALIFTGPIFLVNWESVFDISGDTHAHNLSLSLLMVCLLFYLNLPLTVIQKVQFAYMEHHRVYMWELFSKSMTIGLVFLGIKLEVEFHWLLVAFFLPLMMANLANLLTYKKGELLRLSVGTLHLFKDELREVTSKGGLFFLMGIFYALGRTTDNLVIGAFGSLEQVADFQILMRVLDIPLLLIMILTSILWSAFGDAMARGDTRWVITSIQRISVLILLVMLGTAVGFSIAGDWLITLWLGHDYEINHRLFNVLALWISLVAFFNLLASYMNATNKLWFQVKLFAAYFVLSFPLKIYMLQAYSIEYFVVAGILVYLVVVIIPAVLVVLRDLVSADERRTQPA